MPSDPLGPPIQAPSRPGGGGVGGEVRSQVGKNPPPSRPLRCPYKGRKGVPKRQESEATRTALIPLHAAFQTRAPCACGRDARLGIASGAAAAPAARWARRRAMAPLHGLARPPDGGARAPVGAGTAAATAAAAVAAAAVAHAGARPIAAAAGARAPACGGGRSSVCSGAPAPRRGPPPRRALWGGPGGAPPSGGAPPPPPRAPPRAAAHPPRGAAASRRDFLEARQVSLFELFSGAAFKFDIPDYQRPYSWRPKQARLAGWQGGGGEGKERGVWARRGSGRAGVPGAPSGSMRPRLCGRRAPARPALPTHPLRARRAPR
jgi:hypothetical protein